MENEKEFGCFLHEKRRERKLSQEVLAEMSGISTRWLREIEKGTVNPKLSTVLRLCRACEADVGELAQIRIETDWE